MGRRRDGMTPVEALTVALTTVGTFQGYVQHADAKVATVTTVHLGAAAVAATQMGALTGLRAPGAPIAPGVVAVVLVTLYVAGFLVAGYHLVQGLRPRLGGPAGPNRFGLAGPGSGSSRVSIAQQEREAWLLVGTLAELSREKHRRVGRALPWTALMLVATLLWLALGALYG
ncbi:hypothetical protein [Microbispora siamensis]|uniref:Pycsar effector protein domain-containing protein n=1 Tax=Microbispora siamensis TaxID=564413 RepID=A0ABQ4GHD3_9ACTN|nr:hypothetical protein [Microbispora siamensis]GIH60828.1 hypothetical protein Msi02_16450 [Microbispora siamensis]